MLILYESVKEKKMKALKVGFFISLLFNKYNEDEFIH